MQSCMKLIIKYLDDCVQIYLETVGSSIDSMFSIQFCKSFKSCKSLQSTKYFKSCKSLQLASYQSAACKGGRRQGRSLKIRPHPRRVRRACLSDWNDPFRTQTLPPAPSFCHVLPWFQHSPENCSNFRGVRAAPTG